MATYSEQQQRAMDQEFELQIDMQPRTYGIADAVDHCAKGHITFSECCKAIDALGFKTTGIYEAVRARKEALGIA